MSKYIQLVCLLYMSTKLVENIIICSSDALYLSQRGNWQNIFFSELYGWCTEDRNWGCFRDRGNIPPIASARLQTKSTFSFMYGTVEIIAKLPKGDWLWPGVVLLLHFINWFLSDFHCVLHPLLAYFLSPVKLFIQVIDMETWLLSFKNKAKD